MQAVMRTPISDESGTPLQGTAGRAGRAPQGWQGLQCGGGECSLSRDVSLRHSVSLALALTKQHGDGVHQRDADRKKTVVSSEPR